MFLVRQSETNVNRDRLSDFRIRARHVVLLAIYDIWHDLTITLLRNIESENSLYPKYTKFFSAYRPTCRHQNHMLGKRIDSNNFFFFFTELTILDD